MKRENTLDTEAVEVKETKDEKRKRLLNTLNAIKDTESKEYRKAIISLRRNRASFTDLELIRINSTIFDMHEIYTSVFGLVWINEGARVGFMDKKLSEVVPLIDKGLDIKSITVILKPLLDSEEKTVYIGFNQFSLGFIKFCCKGEQPISFSASETKQSPLIIEKPSGVWLIASVPVDD